MIKYNCAPTAEFLKKFHDVIVVVARKKMGLYISTIPEPIASRYRAFFDFSMISNILLCQPHNLLSHIHNIYSNFPELADRFWPAYLLSGCPIPENIESHHIKSKKGKIDLQAIVMSTDKFISKKNTNQLTLIPALLKDLRAATTASQKRKALTRISKAAQGDLTLTDNELKSFPKWINEFSTVFDYPHLSQNYGHNIVNEWKIDICLYCNDEGIQSRGEEDQFKTDLDHFYPKSKFPFLAISLYNLVPAGGFCNQKFKKDSDMLDSMHPFEDGASEIPLFHINYPLGGKLLENNYSVDLWPQNHKIDRNLEMFKIAHYYSSNREVRSLTARTFRSVELILGLGKKNISADAISEITKSMLEQIIDISLPPHTSRKKKFIVDSVNQFAGKKIFDYL
ncbi:hypothetical protein [Pseudomonas asplenii]|uniref:hypothetical protein n=1 Tax=Pseudomonas asplenii TaxID=53407 RepID=UPI002233EE68|nr:hypothetical protein [Pseudomonas asplenii]UZE26658.1 hypothetical protein LOY63_14705 [Pseudomonas asplenii]